MRVYHGTTSIIMQPELRFSRPNLDFGRGFYLTTYQEQAVHWAKRKALRQAKPAIVNVYELTDNLSPYKTLSFDDDRKWIEFVCECRRGSNCYQHYDLIIGNVANDKVYVAVDMYYKGLWDIDRTLKELKFYSLNDQICIVTQKVIDESLSFIESFEVPL